jgi:hypothetical protein
VDLSSVSRCFCSASCQRRCAAWSDDGSSVLCAPPTTATTPTGSSTSRTTRWAPPPTPAASTTVLGPSAPRGPRPGSRAGLPRGEGGKHRGWSASSRGPAPSEGRARTRPRPRPRPMRAGRRPCAQAPRVQGRQNRRSRSFSPLAAPALRRPALQLLGLGGTRRRCRSPRHGVSRRMIALLLQLVSVVLGAGDPRGGVRFADELITDPGALLLLLRRRRA